MRYTTHPNNSIEIDGLVTMVVNLGIIKYDRRVAKKRDRTFTRPLRTSMRASH